MAEFNGIINKIIKDLLDLAKVCVDHLNAVRESQVKCNILCIAGTF